jgi:hypothetical protein
MERLRSFSMHRTWRWRPDPGEQDVYHALETTDDGLRFFEWSHVDAIGLRREARQSFDSFAREGAAWPLPADIASALGAWLAANRSG